MTKGYGSKGIMYTFWHINELPKFEEEPVNITRKKIIFEYIILKMSLAHLVTIIVNPIMLVDGHCGQPASHHIWRIHPIRHI